MPISKAKQTKRFLKSGQLDGQIKKRREARQFKNKVKGRQVKRVHGVPAHQLPAEGEDYSEDELVAKPKKKAGAESDSDSEMDVDAVLGGEGVDDDDDENGQGSDAEVRVVTTA